MAFGGQALAQAAQQPGERVKADQQRLAAVQDDREAGLLAVGLFDQPAAHCIEHHSVHALGLPAPCGVRSLVHVAISAIEIAAACGLDEDRVHVA